MAYELTWETEDGLRKAYGHEYCLRNIQHNPGTARTNIDHYAYFAMAAHFGNGDIYRFEIDPDDIES